MKRPSYDMGNYILLSFLFVLLAAALPANKQASQIYHLSNAQYHLLLFLVLLPLLLLAFLAFYGYSKLQNYANAIDATPEGKDFQQVARGVQWLAWGLLIPAMIGLVLNSLANAWTGFHATSIILTNYITLVVPLVAFSFISTGSHGLLAHARTHLTINKAKSLILIFVLIGVAYCFLTFRHFAGLSVGSTANPYFLPLWLMLLTIVIPYLYAWFIGLLASYEIMLFSRSSQGVLYRHALQQLAGGLVIVIASSIALQYIASITPRTGHLSLNNALGLTYAVRLSAAIGYILIARGAIRLKRIEEV